MAEANDEKVARVHYTMAQALKAMHRGANDFGSEDAEQVQADVREAWHHYGFLGEPWES